MSSMRSQIILAPPGPENLSIFVTIPEKPTAFLKLISLIVMWLLPSHLVYFNRSWINCLGNILLNFILSKVHSKVGCTLSSPLTIIILIIKVIKKINIHPCFPPWLCLLPLLFWFFFVTSKVCMCFLDVFSMMGKQL